jgi:4-amino-4-deoxy-L-arabinose transferase-like glycosyltransferase
MAVLMPYRAPALDSAVWRWRLLAALLILGSAGLHVAYLAFHCPLDLAPDEAHYWDWSRHLDWSYYSKGPLVAWLIRAGCTAFGTGVLGVRLPAVVCGSLLLVSLYVLTVQVYGRERLACAVVAIALTLPVIAAGSSLMTIDSPYTCCWGWALVFGYQAAVRRSAWAWPLAGLAVAVGILAKYTMVVWLPSLGLFLLTSSAHRGLLLRPGFWVACGVAALGCLPIAVWNAQHGWVTYYHVLRLAGLAQHPVPATVREPKFYWQGPLIYVGTQFALLLGYWFVLWVAALWAQRPWKETDEGRRYLWWMSVPMFALFLAFGVKTKGGEPNWPITAYISGLVLTAGWLVRHLVSPVRWYRRLTVGGLVAASGLGLLLTLFVHRSDWTYPLLVKLAGPPTAEQPQPLRRLDPTCRLRGWRTLGAELDRIVAQLRAEGTEPVLAGMGWALPGEIGFYCAGHPTAYSAGRVMGDRHSQYDEWHPNPVADPGPFAGRTFVIVGGFPAELDCFDSIDPPRTVTHYERGQPVASWTVVVCRGFRRFPPVQNDDY